MSAHKVPAGSVYYYISPLNDGNYDTVVCGTSIGKDDSVDEIDASSQCGPDILPGKLNISRSFEGQHMQDPVTGEISGTDLRLLLYSKTLVGYKIATTPLLAETGDEIETGEGYFTALSSTYAFDSNAAFTFTFRPSGVPTITTES